MGIVLVVVLASSAAYFKYSQDKLAEANQKVAAEMARAESAEANIKFMQESLARQQRNLGKLADESVLIRKEQQETINIFSEHDIQKLAEAKPGLIETRVNRGTKRVFDELEAITDPTTYKSKENEDFLKGPPIK
jgi:hypothetical protein